MRRILRSPLLCVAMSIGLFTPILASDYLVLPDGSGDFPTIQEAIDHAVDGDVIQLGYGRFTGSGNRDLLYRGKAITVRSQSGHPETCIIDCEGSETNYVRAFVFDGEGPGSVLRGVTIERGYMDNLGLPMPYGGGILFIGNANPNIVNITIRNCGAFAGGGFAAWPGSPRFTRCRFEQNGSCGGGGGICFDGSPEFTDCEFVDNAAQQGGGGLTVTGAGFATLTGCLFANNRLIEIGYGGGIEISFTTAALSGCTFIDNSAIGDGGGLRCTPPPGRMDRGYPPDIAGGAISAAEAFVTISECTMVGNYAREGGTIGLVYGSGVDLHNSILASNASGAVFCETDADTLSVLCTDIYQNTGGDWTGCVADQAGIHGNLSLDPLFCDLAGDDLTLPPDSPCAPENSGGCGLIGAWPVTCGASSVGDEPPHAFGPLQIRVVPNPTPGACRIEMAVPTISNALVVVTDVAGKTVRELNRGPLAAPPTGGASRLWDGRAANGQQVPSGIYFVRVRTAGGTAVRPVVIVR